MYIIYTPVYASLLSEEEAKRELKQRETLMQVSPVFHPIIGSKEQINTSAFHPRSKYSTQ